MEPIVLTAIDPSVIKFVLEREDGSGIVELPILCETASIDLSRTATGAKRTESISHDDLVEAASNFAHWPGPVPVHRYPHRSMEEASGVGDGFIDQLAVRGTKLWAKMDLTSDLFQEVKARKWRGFSVDCGRGTVRPTKKFSGFVVARGVFTNQPATDVNFKVAASAHVDVDLGAVFTPIEARDSEPGKGPRMTTENQDATVQLATAKAELTVKEEKIASLSASLTTANKEVVDKERERAALSTKLTDAEAQLSTARLSVDGLKHQLEEKDERITQLSAELTEVKTKLSRQENESIGKQVLALCRKAVDEGVPPASIAQFGDYEKDPVGMLKLSFGGSIDAFTKLLKALPRDASLAAVNSGRPKTEGDDDSNVNPTIAAELSRRGLNPKYANIDNTEQLAALSQKK